MFPIRPMLGGLALLFATALIAIVFRVPSATHDQTADLNVHLGQIPKLTDRLPRVYFAPDVTGVIHGTDTSETVPVDLDGSLAIEFPIKGPEETPVRARKAMRHTARATKPAANKSHDAFAFSQAPNQNNNYKPVAIPPPNFTNSAY